MLSAQPIAEPVVAILLALLVGAVGITLCSGLLAGHKNFDVGLPAAAYRALLEGVASPNGITSTLDYSTPLILAGLGVGLGFKAGLFNIGGRGQFLFGTVGAMAVATTVGVSQNAIHHDPAGPSGRGRCSAPPQDSSRVSSRRRREPMRS